MPLSWSEIKPRASTFAKHWADAAYGYKGTNTDAARVVFLFELYQKMTFYCK